MTYDWFFLLSTDKRPEAITSTFCISHIEIMLSIFIAWLELQLKLF